MNLNEVGRDSFISHRQLLNEANNCFDSLLEQMASAHIASLNLVTVISCCCNIARQRPEFFPQVHPSKTRDLEIKSTHFSDL